MIREVCVQLHQLKKRNAFVDIEKKFYAQLELFDVSREGVQNIIDKYEECEMKIPL